MRYELIIEKTQPSCGGKLPRTSEISEVETNSPMEYVKAKEPEVAWEESTDEDGTIIITGSKGMEQVRYEFTAV